MTEKLRSNNIENKVERKYPADKYRVESKDYPVFRLQWAYRIEGGSEIWGIDRTASEFVTDTANVISMIDGTARDYEEKGLEKPDHVIYLDKSARPVSWLVSVFWDDFSQEKRPEHSFMNIDRVDWFKRVGLQSDADGNIPNENTRGSRRGTAADFINRADKLPKEFIAGIRALYVDGGVDTDDPDEIMKMPTTLDGKNVLIVDEVKSSGATKEIAEYLLQKAIPEVKSVNGTYFWDPEFKSIDKGGGVSELQRLSVPIWYDPKKTSGRGIGEIEEGYYREQYEKHPTPRNRARKLGAFALSRPVDLAEEEGAIRSRDVMQDILQLHEDYQKGKVFLGFVKNWDFDRADEEAEARGLRFAPETDRSPDTMANVKKMIYARKSELN